LLVLIAWMFMTTVFSLYPWLAWEQWDKVWRIMLMTYVTMMLINDEHRIKLLDVRDRAVARILWFQGRHFRHHRREEATTR
jgi:hypothetical protein